jgi:hypothetical protein
MKCSMCEKNIPKERVEFGFTICIKCSTEEKKLGHIIYPHKTGAYIQVVDKSTHEDLNRLDRRGGSSKTARQYKSFSVNKPEPKTFRDRKCNKVYTNYDVALEKVNDYYERWGYEPVLQYLRKLNSSGDIPLLTRVKIQDIITERYLNPSPRALKRKFKSNNIC